MDGLPDFVHLSSCHTAMHILLIEDDPLSPELFALRLKAKLMR